MSWRVLAGCVVLFVFVVAHSSIAQGILVTKILSHNLKYDSSSGRVIHIINNPSKYNLTNITIIDMCKNFKRKFVIPFLPSGKEKRIEYSPDISQNCTLVSKVFYWLGEYRHELVEKKVEVVPKNSGEKTNILLPVLLSALVVSVLLIFAKRKI